MFLINDAVAIICSRPESKRLPGKVFKKIAGYPALEHILKRTKDYVKTVLAIPSGGIEESAIIEYQRLADYYGAEIWEGDADSPLHRMANFFTTRCDKTKYLVRITHDDLLIDGKTIEELITACDRENAGYGISKGIVEGAGVEVIRRENLLAAAQKHKEQTEYVSYFVQGEGMPFQKIVHLEPRESIQRNYRLTMDYHEDAQVLDIVLRQTGIGSSVDEICQFLDQHPYILNINKQPTLSIYTCAYNAEKTISETINSALASPMSDIEYIVIDDASTDATPVKIAQFAHDKRLKIILNETNIGLASSSNIAIDKARGKYIMRVDADDVLISDMLGDFIATMNQTRFAALYPRYREINESGDVISGTIRGDLHFHAGCAIMDKRILNEIRFKDGLRNWDGLELYKRLSARCDVGFSDKASWFYRKRTDSMSNTNLSERKKQFKDLSNASS